MAAVLLGYMVGRNCGGGVLNASDHRPSVKTTATTDLSLADTTRLSADKWSVFVAKLDNIANNVEELKQLGRRLVDGHRDKRASSGID